LIKLAATRSTRTIRDTRASLVRIITYAQARGLVGRNVVALIKAPKGQAPGRPSKSLTVAQARAVQKAAEADRLNAYFVLPGDRVRDRGSAGAAVGPRRPRRADAVGGCTGPRPSCAALQAPRRRRSDSGSRSAASELGKRGSSRTPDSPDTTQPPAVQVRAGQ
jgi:hypothetical protein